MKRGMYLATITTPRGGATMRMFEVADVKQTYRLRVPELTRPEVFAQLSHYKAADRFFMVNCKCMGGRGAACGCARGRKALPTLCTRPLTPHPVHPPLPQRR